MPVFKFEMKQIVKLIESAEYAHSENCYYIRYMAGDGRQVESWWGESALEAY